MIEVCEGLGGWTIKVINKGHSEKNFECGDFVKKSPSGLVYFDFDEAMKQARTLDKQQKQKRQ